MGLQVAEVIKSVVIAVLIFERVQLCHGRFKPVGRIKTMNAMQSTPNLPWEKDYDEELPEGVFPAVQTRKSNNNPQEALLNQILETVISNEKYLKKISNIEISTRSMDAGINNVNDVMTKRFEMISEQLEIQNSKEKEVIKELNYLQREISEVANILGKMKNLPDKKQKGVDYTTGLDSKCESKLVNIEGVLKSLTESVDKILTVLDSHRSGFARNNRRTDLNEKPIQDNVFYMLNEFKRILREKSKNCDCSKGSFRSQESFPADCYEIQSLGFNVTGIYKVKPEESDAFYALCDMHTAGGGWTVFQNRFDGSQDFYKSWSEYTHGFGNLAGEFWLGLEKLHYLSNQKLYELRIQLESHTGEEAYALYTVFSVGPEVEGYRISTIGSYKGDAGDSLTYHSGQKFTTFDVDNDEWKDGVCAAEHGGAWWYRHCDKSNLNGKYAANNARIPKSQGIYWNTFKGSANYLTRTKMMIRPLPVSRSKPIPEGTVSASITSTKFNDLTRKSSLNRVKPLFPKDADDGKIPFIPLDDEPEQDITRWNPADD